MDRIHQHFGNYRLLRLLGKGRVAEVYLGEHVYLQSYAAVKILHAHTEQDEIANFLALARTFVHLVHPHIIHLLEFGVENTIPFLVMDYAPNGSLRQQYPKGTQLPLPTIATYVNQIADALQYAHSEKIVFRDIKPENILLGRHHEIMLSGFGIASATNSSNTQDIIGSVAYMAPEQIQASPLPASNQYSLGVLVYEWLCGDCPFHGSVAEIAVKHCITPPPSLREKAPLISSAVEQVVMKALAKVPEDRFSDIHTFAAALDATILQYQLHQQANPMFINRELKPSNTSVSKNQLLSIERQVKQPQLHFPQPSRRKTILVLAGVAIVSMMGSGAFLLSHVGKIDTSQTNTQDTQPPSLNYFPRATPVEVRKPPLYTYNGHSSWVYSVAWSPDGKRIATGGDDSTVQVWDATNGDRAYTSSVPPPRAISDVAWSPNGKYIAIAVTNGYGNSSDKNNSGKLVHILDAADGRDTFIYRGHTQAKRGVNAVAWSPDGKRIASASDDKTIQVWNASDGSHVYTYRGHTDNVFAVAWSPDGKHIASGGDDAMVQIWDAVNGAHASVFMDTITAVDSVVWSPNNRYIAWTDLVGMVQCWDALTGKHVSTYRTHHANGDWHATSAAWSPDGRYLAAVFATAIEGRVEVWEAATGFHAQLYGVSSHAYCIAWSPNSKRIVCGSVSGTVQIWQVG